MPVRQGWVLTQLEEGDALGPFPGFTPDPGHDLSDLYDLTPRQIVEGNGIRFETNAIQGDGGWIHKVAGGRKYNGFWHFDKTTRIYLPPGGPRRPVAAVVTKKPGSSLWKWLGWGALGVGAIVLVSKMSEDDTKKRRRSTSADEE